MYHQSQDCVEACLRCAELCDACAEACLDERDVVERLGCIRLSRECASICMLTASFMGHESDLLEDVCRNCIHLCALCRDECSKFPEDYCQECAHACAACAEACCQAA